MQTLITVTDNILSAVGQEIKQTAGVVLTDAGELFKSTAKAECPRSSIDAPGYVHLQDTIGYEADADSLVSQMWVTFWVIKSYAQFVNDGTSRMPPRPFFTDGVNMVAEHFDDAVRKRFAALMLGKVMGPAK